MPSEAQIDQFKSKLRGQLIGRDDPGYAEACKVYNGMIHKRPLLIARCTDVADVIAAVEFGRENLLLTSIRGGGHNAGGLGVCDDGLVIDLTPMRYVRVDPKAKRVRVGGGSVWGEVDHATHPFGLAVPAGTISTTGVAGLTLGGGIGHLTRRYGLTIDNLLSADMVVADGSFVTASAKQNEDLFWAIRGGGGNFGVITSFEFQAHPVQTVHAGPMLWEMSEAETVLQWYREFLTQAPEELSGFFAFLTVPPAPIFPEHLHMRKMCAIVWCYAGGPRKAAQALKPAREFSKPALDLAGPLPYPVLQSMFDGLYPPGLQWYWKADFVKTMSDEAIRLRVEHGSKLPTMHSTVHIYPINGATARVGASDTPWNYRDAVWAEVMVGVDPDPAKKDLLVNWARGYWDALHPHSMGAAYVNFMMEEGEDRVQASYRGSYDRLAAIKAKYDPANFFRVNQNIKPKS
ncbi:MAG: FAD-binding oxidoreductase [Acidobacteria bacterium]|nr:FAD-binding oxidoreductase [Acidobacteriota bacterium]